MKLSKSDAAKIINDLLQKFPRGPKGSKGLKRDDYCERECWDDITGDYRRLVQPATDRSKHYGYSQEIILQLSTMDYDGDGDGSFRTTEWDFRNAVRALYPELGYRGKAITSRSRRLARRIGKPVNKLVRSGDLPGVYRVEYGYGTTGGQICAYGNSANDAKIVVEMMTKHAYNGDDSRSVDLISTEDVNAITKYNARAVKQCQKEIDRLQSKIAEWEKSIANLESKKDTIQSFSTLQVSAMLDAMSAAS